MCIHDLLHAEVAAINYNLSDGELGLGIGHAPNTFPH